MKKIMFFILLLPSIVMAEAQDGVLIFNRSDHYDITIVYRICNTGGGDDRCTENREITITAKQNMTRENTNYFYIAPEPTLINLPKVEIMSAVERDAEGNIIAKGEYTLGARAQASGHSNCQADIYSGSRSALILDDVLYSPYIVCASDWGSFY